MAYNLEQIAAALRMRKIAFSTVEKELGFSNGLIGKAVKGQSKLSEEKMIQFQEYHARLPKTLPTNEPIQIPIPATNVAINKVAENHRVDPDGGIHGIALYSMEKIKELTQIEGVTTGDKAPEPKKKKDLEQQEPIILYPDTWIGRIEEFCEKEGITPEDLIESYKSRNKPVKEKASDVLKKDQKSSGGQRYDLRAIKLGIKNDK